MQQIDLISLFVDAERLRWKENELISSCNNTLRKVQKILQNALKSKNMFQSFNVEVYEKIFF